MKIETKFLGEVEIQEEQIITFEHGLPGFPDNKSYTLLGLDVDLPITLLQSTEEAQLGFVVAYPFAFKKDYSFDLSEEDKEALKLSNEQDAAVYTVLTLKENFSDSTINLLAPIILNTKEKLGKQIILHDSKKYSLRHQVGVVAEGSVK